MKNNLVTALLMTIATTILLGIIYPLVVTGLAQVLFPRQANGELIEANGKVVGSQLIAQAFTDPGYFHPRPSAAGYDPKNSNGSQLSPTNQKLIDRVKSDVAADHAENPSVPVPIDLVTASASGLDPDITPAAAEFQLDSVAKERAMTLEQLRALVARHTVGRQFGILGEPRVNVLELNLELDHRFPMKKQAKVSHH
ncbi:MAG TPA: potassium-transporting ATPase subunit KdpC [Terriglobales bacterium]|nr:potassium-transporting ATPase subunit KdpC [Terriglobales bacterium]